MMRAGCRLLPLTGLALALSLLAGCLGARIEENNQLIQEQQAQIEQQQQEIASLKAQPYTPTPPPGGTCDKDVMATATRRGGEKFAAGDFARALGYYQDALTACPGNPRAELNLARTHEAMGTRDAAIENYRLAASSSDPDEHEAEEQARTALARLTGSR